MGAERPAALGGAEVAGAEAWCQLPCTSWSRRGEPLTLGSAADEAAGAEPEGAAAEPEPEAEAGTDAASTLASRLAEAEGAAVEGRAPLLSVDVFALSSVLR